VRRLLSTESPIGRLAGGLPTEAEAEPAAVVTAKAT
jgi:hypothetical protein